MKSKVGKNLKILLFLGVILAACAISGCSLAVPDAGKSTSDRLIGAFITTEYLDLYDMDSYLSDHASSLADGSSIMVGEESKYQGKLQATVDKSQGEDIFSWKISFGNIEGQYLLMPVTEAGDGNKSVGNFCSDGISAPFIHYNTTDNGEERDLSGTLYLLPQKDKEQVYYVNPVYQTSDGEIYVMTGNGYSTGNSDEEGDTMSATLSAENTVTEGKISKTDQCTVTVKFAIQYRPVRTILYQMDASNKVLKQAAYNPSAVPEILETEPGTAYIMIENRKETPDGKLISERTIFDYDSAQEEEKNFSVLAPFENQLVMEKVVEVK